MIKIFNHKYIWCVIFESVHKFTVQVFTFSLDSSLLLHSIELTELFHLNIEYLRIHSRNPINFSYVHTVVINHYDYYFGQWLIGPNFVEDDSDIHLSIWLRHWLIDNQWFIALEFICQTKYNFLIIIWYKNFF
jgi:hypothetical protein